MIVVPNAAFSASFPNDSEFEHPLGCYLARQLRIGLSTQSAEVSDFENWRDCGWSIECDVEGRRFEIYFSVFDVRSSPNVWMIGIQPLGQPGFVKRLLGSKPLPYLAQSRMLASAVHEILSGDSNIFDIRWAMNANPTESEVHDPCLLLWGDGTVA